MDPAQNVHLLGFIAILTENNALKQRYSELEASSRIEISRLIFNLF